MADRRARLASWATGAVALLFGCSAALTPLTTEQAEGLKEAQRVADLATRAYGVPGVRVYATPGLRPTTGAGYLYQQDWVFIRPELLTGHRFLVAITHELGHATLGHRPVDLPRAQQRAAIADGELAASRRGVEIMVRFLGVSERQALEHYAAYFIEANRVREGRDILIPVGHPLPCEQLRDLWASFGRTSPPCEAFTAVPDVRECPYDDWMSTGCKAGQPLN
jgi:hypothetical protein